MSGGKSPHPLYAVTAFTGTILPQLWPSHLYLYLCLLLRERKCQMNHKNGQGERKIMSNMYKGWEENNLRVNTMTYV